MDSVDVKALCDIRGVSGHEGEVRAHLRTLLEGHVDDLRADTIGNLFARKAGRRASPVIMIAAHMDEVGFLVTGADKSGMLHFTNVGGIVPAMLPSKVVRIGPAAIPGVIGTKAVHLQEASERTKPFDPEKLRIDIGASSREQAMKLVKRGDQITWDVEFGEFGSALWKGRALDDRVGCAILAEVLRQAEYEVPVVGVFTVQEEVGLRGAAVASYAVEPQIAVCLEGTVCADIPGVEEQAYTTRVGQGPAISLMDAGTIHSPVLVRHLVSVAEREGIPYQYREATRGGNDTARMTMAKAGAPGCAISVPCRYIHSPVAVCSPEDYRNAVRLVRAFVDSIGRGELTI